MRKKVGMPAIRVTLCRLVMPKWLYGVHGRFVGGTGGRRFVGVVPVRDGQQESRYCTSLDELRTTAQAAGSKFMPFKATLRMYFNGWASTGFELL